MQTYVVQPGDSVDRIASAFQIPAQDIIFVNQLLPPYALAVGQALLIESAAEMDAEQTPGPNLISFGYAYTYISPWILRQTLPYLTDLHIFSYGFTTEGVLIPPPQDDPWMIALSRSFGVRPISHRSARMAFLTTH